jgi:hypothetical protein
LLPIKNITTETGEEDKNEANNEDVQDENDVGGESVQKGGATGHENKETTTTKTLDTSPLFFLGSDTATDNESTNEGVSTNDKVGKQDETTINDVDTGSEVVVSGQVPIPETVKRNNKVSFSGIAGNKVRKVSYVDNHSW